MSRPDVIGGREGPRSRREAGAHRQVRRKPVTEPNKVVVVVVVVIREHAHETSTDTKASVLPVGEVVVTAGATLHGATHTTSSDSDMVGASSHVHTYDTRTYPSALKYSCSSR